MANSKYLNDCPAFHPQAFKNRFNPKIEYICSLIFETNKLNCSIDNWRFLRPYKIFTDKDEDEYILNKQWQSNMNRHWDYSPWLFVKESTQNSISCGMSRICCFK